MNFNKILIAVDDSAFAMKAGRLGFELAHKLNASIGIIFVIDKSMETGNPDLVITPQQQHTVLLEEAENTIKQYIDLYDGIDKVYRFTPEGEPAKEILNIATEWEADIIVMGTHGRSGITKLFSGSVTEYVLKHSEIPVIVAPPEMKS